MDDRTGDSIGTWAAATTLLLGLVACSLPADAARLVGRAVLIGAGIGTILVGIVNLRWALRLDGHDAGPAVLGTAIPALGGSLLVFCGFHETAALVALRALGVLTAGLGLALLVPPPGPVADALSRASGRRRTRRGAAVR